MREILLTSSVLIVAILALRLVFRNRISRRAQYALWALVLVRLLVPVNLPAVDFSVLTAAEPVVQQLETDRSLYLSPVRETVIGSAGGDPSANTPAPNYPVAVGKPSPDNTHVFTDSSDVTHAVEYERQLDLSTLLRWMWYTGMAVVGGWLAVSNLLFWHRLRQVRVPYPVEGRHRPVYLVESGLPSPCLFGPFRPAIYLTPAAVSSPERLRHVLAHEETHARHGDALWSLLRGVCLTVYWFDPLVWVAAAVSKADCELACDEGALRRLGQEERIPYGRTLLSLIPVSKKPANPLLSATTMTAGKRRLKDRITQIAQGGQPQAAALFLVLALTAVVCAATFTGAKAEERRPLTGDELAYFNETFFNNDTVDHMVGVNIHNQFLTSLYERPEDINLYELFYCGTGIDETMTDEELRQVGDFDPDGELICPVDKMPVETINQVLLENTGLTLEETGQTGLENFQYIPEYDAYYHSHGDTNYFHGVQITAGERDGNTVRLYYPDSSARYDSDWLCVTLEAQDDGSYWFVSNQPSEKPAIPTAYPEGDPVLTIPLADLEPTGSADGAPVPVTHRQDDCADQGYGVGVTAENGEDVSIYPYLSTDGNVYVAVVYARAAGTDLWDAGCFLTLPEGNSLTYGESDVSLDFFHDLFGHDGVVVSYLDSAAVAAYQAGIVRDYYYFDAEGNPVHLAQVCGGDTAILDLDGDGENELLSDSGQLVFQRDGQLYTADLEALLQDQWEDFLWWDYALIDESRRCLTVRGTRSMSEWGENARCEFLLDFYYDGKSVLIYNRLEDTMDHAAVSVANADLPEQVLADAKATVQAAYESARSGGTEDASANSYDDWRVSYLNLTGTYRDYPTGPIEVYGVSHEFHAADPAHIVLAGGMYIQEDGWVGGFYTDSSPYLVYEVQADGSRTRLESHMAGDYSEDSPAYRADLCFTLMENGLVTWADLPGEDLYNMFWMNESAFLNNLAAGADGAAQEAALTALVEYGSTFDPTQFQQGLDNLALSSSLSKAGLEAYERLLVIVNGETEPPTEVDIQAAILNHRVNATAHQYNFSTEAHRVLDTAQDGSVCTVYLLVWYSAYERTATGWQSGTDGQFPAAVTFIWQNGGWEVTDYQEPASYAADLRTIFPEELADMVVNDGEAWAALQDECRAKAEAYFAENPATAEPLQTDGTSAFSAADENFSGQALTAAPDEMTYDERLAWVQAAEFVPDDFISVGQYAESGGNLAYLGQWVGTPHMDQYSLVLRFSDGSEASLPLPHATDMGFAQPDTLEFRDGQLLYAVTFPTQAVSSDGQTLIHLAGTYRYTVDLAAKTVSLAITES